METSTNNSTTSAEQRQSDRHGSSFAASIVAWAALSLPAMEASTAPAAAEAFTSVAVPEASTATIQGKEYKVDGGANFIVTAPSQDYKKAANAMGEAFILVATDFKANFGVDLSRAEMLRRLPIMFVVANDKERGYVQPQKDIAGLPDGSAAFVYNNQTGYVCEIHVRLDDPSNTSLAANAIREAVWCYGVLAGLKGQNLASTYAASLGFGGHARLILDANYVEPEAPNAKGDILMKRPRPLAITDTPEFRARLTAIGDDVFLVKLRAIISNSLLSRLHEICGAHHTYGPDTDIFQAHLTLDILSFQLPSDMKKVVAKRIALWSKELTPENGVALTIEQVENLAEGMVKDLKIGNKAKSYGITYVKGNPTFNIELLEAWYSSQLALIRADIERKDK